MSDVDALVSALTLEEKASLTAGGGMMSTAPVERVGIPVVNVTTARSPTGIPDNPTGTSWSPALPRSRVNSPCGHGALPGGRWTPVATRC
jgi:hypothetical protein